VEPPLVLGVLAAQAVRGALQRLLERVRHPAGGALRGAQRAEAQLDALAQPSQEVDHRLRPDAVTVARRGSAALHLTLTARWKPPRSRGARRLPGRRRGR